MARTRKDAPERIRFPHHYSDLKDLPKRKRVINDNWNWLFSTPSYWTRLMMNRPKRRACSLWEHEVELLRVEDLEDIEDCPDYGNKPHIYYW